MRTPSRPKPAAHSADRVLPHALWLGWPSGKNTLVPIRSLNASHRERIAAHLLALEPRDRYLRFGYLATDAQVTTYVHSLNFDQDEIFGIYNHRIELIGMAHLAYAPHRQRDACAEFGVSVAPAARGQGYGGRLFDRAVMHARNNGVNLLFIHALSENTAMLRIARSAGATVEHDGSEAQAYLRLRPATLDSRLSEIMAEHLAQTDYQFKVQARQLWALLGEIQAVRRGVAAARHQSAP